MAPHTPFEFTAKCIVSCKTPERNPATARASLEVDLLRRETAVLGNRAFVRAFDPVEAVRAQENEVNDQSKCEQKCTKPNKCLTRVEKKPKFVHVCVFSQVNMESVVLAVSSMP